MEKRGINRYIFLLFVCLSILCLLVFVINRKLLAAGVSDANLYYYSSGRKIELPLSKKMIAVRFKPKITSQQKRTIAESEKHLGMFSQRKDLLIYELTLLPMREGVTEENIVETISSLNGKSEVEFANPVFGFHDAELIFTDEFIVKFDPNMSEEQIEAFNAQNGVEIARKPEWTERYTLRVKDTKNMNTLRTANLYYESPITIFSMPNFIRRLRIASVTPDDGYFGKQWHMNNTGQVPPGGDDDADIDAPEGWEISTGSSDIVIAITDEGVDYNHDDLAANIWVNEDEQPGDGNGDDRPGVKLVDDDGDGLVDEDSKGRSWWEDGWTNDLVDDDDENGYNDDFYGWDFVDLDGDGIGDNDPAPWENDAHGTACAGIAAATTNNEIGVAGVSWSCKIMPIKIGYDAYWTTEEWAANGIEYASDNGADVLSNSWGGTFDSDTIHDGIIEAKNNGRNGKGCVIVFSSGNWLEGGPVLYPAKYAEVIAVGATDQDDVIWYYSGHGDELDVVAPSGLTSGQGNIWTTDITGSAGYNNRDPLILDYTDKMGGTSAAAPQVAGLAGLILSVNSNLTSDQVQLIIECTADDKGATGWDQYYGWGRINVYNALYAALSYPGGFCVKDSSGDVVARFDILGNLFLEGTLQQNPNRPPTGHDEFRFQDSEGEEVAIIDATDGEMYIDGQKHENQVQLNPPANSFIIKNRDGEVVAYIDVSGNVYLTGKVYENLNQ